MRNMGRKVGTIRHTGAALALALILSGRAGAELQLCDWADQAFWKQADLAQVDRCIAAGADLEARDENGETPLHHAVGGGTPEAVAALLAAGADPKARDWSGRSPADRAKFNPDVRNHDIFRMLNDGRLD